jgi:hypothetical protein
MSNGEVLPIMLSAFSTTSFRAAAADFNLSTDRAEEVSGRPTRLPTSSMAIAWMVSLIYSPSLVHRQERQDPPMRRGANERLMLA